MRALSFLLVLLLSTTAGADGLSYSSYPPSGTANGVLQGTYPSPSFATGVVYPTNVSTCTTPGFTFNNDLNTGMNDAAGFDTLQLCVAGSIVGFFSAGGNVGLGGSSVPTAVLDIEPTAITAGASGAGQKFFIEAYTFTDSLTAGSATAATNPVLQASFGQATLAASNTLVTTTTASSFAINNAPIAGTNQTITTSVGLRVGAGTSLAGGGAVTTGLGLQALMPTGATTNYAARFDSTAGVFTGQFATKGPRSAIVNTNQLGGWDMFSDDTSLTAPGSVVATIAPVATETHTASALGTDIIFKAVAPTTTTLTEVARFTGAGALQLLGVTQTHPKSFTTTYDPASLAAQTARCDAVTVTGITTGGGAVTANIGAVNPATGCAMASVRASAADTVTVCWMNTIDAVTACDTASSTWKFTQAQ